MQRGDLVAHALWQVCLLLGLLRVEQGLRGEFDDAQRLVDLMGDGGSFQAAFQLVAHQGQGLLLLLR